MTKRKISIPKLVATSVVRGSKQGDSHGGVYTIDFESQEVKQHIDWDRSDIDFTGRGWDRGLRGIEFYQGNIYIAASDELFIYDKFFVKQDSFRNPYLKHCHEIWRKDHLLFLTSTGYDSLLTFDLKRGVFVWGIYITSEKDNWVGHGFNPTTENGPPFVNKFHINSVYVDDSGIYLSGLRTEALLYIDSEFNVSEICSLPVGAHNARPFRDGLIFNDTSANCVRFVGRNGMERAFNIITYNEAELDFAGIDDSKIARQGFGRGLCPLDDNLVVAGSSPSTISVYDIESGDYVASVNLTMDIRNAIHGLEVWPYN